MVTNHQKYLFCRCGLLAPPQKLLLLVCSHGTSNSNSNKIPVNCVVPKSFQMTMMSRRFMFISYNNLEFSWIIVLSLIIWLICFFLFLIDCYLANMFAVTRSRLNTEIARNTIIRIESKQFQLETD